MRPAFSSGPVSRPQRKSSRTVALTALAGVVAVRPPQLRHPAATPSGTVMVVLSITSTAAKRASTGCVTGSRAPTTWATAALRTASNNVALALVKRWSSPCGLIVMPRSAAIVVRSLSEPAGWASQPSTVVWTKAAAVSLLWRWR
jgi:hypothetical protein